MLLNGRNTHILAQIHVLLNNHVKLAKEGLTLVLIQNVQNVSMVKILKILMNFIRNLLCVLDAI